MVSEMFMLRDPEREREGVRGEGLWSRSHAGVLLWVEACGNLCVCVCACVCVCMCVCVVCVHAVGGGIMQESVCVCVGGGGVRGGRSGA